MKVGLSLGQRQEQRLALLPKMLQAIEVLQLSAQDLIERIDRELAENETLECVRRRDRDDFDPISQAPAHDLSLHGHLLAQLADVDVEPHIRDVVAFAIGSLDQFGHLMLDEPELVATLGDAAGVAQGLEVLRGFEPKGVGQAGPVESMLAQIDRTDPDAGDLEVLVCDHLPDLAKQRFGAVAKALGLSVAEVRARVTKLRGLDPCPGRAFAAAEPTAIHPDVVVRREDGAWEVRVDDALVPRLAVSAEYERLARDAAAPDRVRRYLRGKIGSARDIVRAVEQRKETLGRVARAIVDAQPDFLERGLSGLRPMKMQAIADAVGVHVSTVSRATAAKYLQTDFGIFAIRDLFDGGSGAAGAARSSVKDQVRSLIASEDAAHPLSDAAIAGLLAERGLRVARRTVAKYRRDLGLPGRFERRR